MVLWPGCGQISIGSSRWRIKLRPTQSEPLANPRGQSPERELSNSTGVTSAPAASTTTLALRASMSERRWQITCRTWVRSASRRTTRHSASRWAPCSVTAGSTPLRAASFLHDCGAEVGLTGGTVVGVITGHRQVIGMQSATCQIVDQRLVVRRKRRCRRQTDLGGLRAQRIGLAANPEQLFGLGVPGRHLVIADRPGLGHGGIAGVAEVLPGSEIAQRKIARRPCRRGPTTRRFRCR